MLSALLGIPIIVIAVWYGGIYLLLLTALILWLGLAELIKMFSCRGVNTKPVLAFAGGGLLLYAAYAHNNAYFQSSLTALIIIYLLTMLFCRGKESIISISVTFFSTVYMGLITYIYLLRNLPGGWMWLTFLLACIWVNDTAAYFGGKKFGRVPLAREISPGKTREGAILGILSSVAVAYLFTVFYPSLPLVTVLVLGGLVAIAGQVGDLVESAIKRQVGVKDAGNLIPGHGGVLDRFDSMLLGAPLVYYYVGLFIIS